MAANLAAPGIGRTMESYLQMKERCARQVDTINDQNLTLATLAAIVGGDERKTPLTDGELVRAVGELKREHDRWTEALLAHRARVVGCLCSTDEFYAIVSALAPVPVDCSTWNGNDDSRR